MGYFRTRVSTVGGLVGAQNLQRGNKRRGESRGQVKERKQTRERLTHARYLDLSAGVFEAGSSQTTLLLGLLATSTFPYLHADIPISQ